MEIDRLLFVAGGPRIVLGLWLFYPKWKTVEEILGRMWVSASRVQQVLRALIESELIERRQRNVNQRGVKPGVKPFEYRLSFPLAEWLQRKGLVLVDDGCKDKGAICLSKDGRFAGALVTKEDCDGCRRKKKS